MSTRLLILKIAATLATLIASGCDLPKIDIPQPTPAPAPAPQAQTVNLKITVDGEGKIKLDGDADIEVKNTASANSAGVCTCGCGQDGCQCSRASSARTNGQSSSARSGPQFANKANDRPIVKMFTSFRGRECPPCNAAKDAWEAHGKAWPFKLDIEHKDGWQSPTFVYVGTSGREFRRQGFATADDLIQFWRANQ